MAAWPCYRRNSNQQASATSQKPCSESVVILSFPCHPEDRGDECVGRERLLHQAVLVVSPTSAHELVFGVAGHVEHTNRVARLSNRAHQLTTAGTRHDCIRQNEIDPSSESFRRFDALHTIA